MLVDQTTDKMITLLSLMQSMSLNTYQTEQHSRYSNTSGGEISDATCWGFVRNAELAASRLHCHQA